MEMPPGERGVCYLLMERFASISYLVASMVGFVTIYLLASRQTRRDVRPLLPRIMAVAAFLFLYPTMVDVGAHLRESDLAEAKAWCEALIPRLAG